MKHIGTPAYRPTADCIWSAFRSSGKRHLILTGSRGSGKTTLLGQLFDGPLPGVTTWAEPKKAVWLRENTTGETRQVGVFDETLPGPENRMGPTDGFSHWGAAVLARCGETESPWVTVDEVGYLECACPEYLAALEGLMEKKRLAAVVRKQPLPQLQTLCRREDVFTVDLDAPLGRLGCVIMASGLGRRFGSNKLLADFYGKPLVQWALDATEDIFARRVVVTRHEDVAKLCQNQGVEVVLHQLPHRSDTVRLGLQALGDVDGCLFCPGDQPLLRQETVGALALSAAADRASIWRAAWGETVGLPAIFPKWAFGALLSLPEGKGGGYVARQFPDRVRTVSVQDARELWDADTPEALEELKTHKKDTP